MYTYWYLNLLCQTYRSFVSLRPPSWWRAVPWSQHAVIAEPLSEPEGHYSCPPLLVCINHTNQPQLNYTCMYMIYLVLDSLVCWSIKSVISSFSTCTFTLNGKMVLALTRGNYCYSAISLDSMHTPAHSMNSGNGATCTYMYYVQLHVCEMDHTVVHVAWTSQQYVHTYDFPWAVPVWIGVPYFQHPTLLPPPLGSAVSSWMRLRYYTKYEAYHLMLSNDKRFGSLFLYCLQCSCLGDAALLSLLHICIIIYILHAYWESHMYVLGTMLCVD